jgi:hypothetical protein
LVQNHCVVFILDNGRHFYLVNNTFKYKGEEMKQGTSEFDQGYHLGRQSTLQSLVDNPKYREIKEGEFCITLDTIQSILKDEEDKNGRDSNKG